jgi:guanine nucleotide-binding protein subunit alpha
MGVCASTEEQKQSKLIDKLIHDDKRKNRGEVKLLLLGIFYSIFKSKHPPGPGESGKSTIFKQMKIIQMNGGFSPEELQSYKYIVYGNCVSQMKVLVAGALKLNLQFSSPENQVCRFLKCLNLIFEKKRAERLSKVPPSGDAWSSDLGEDIKQLWKDAKAQEIFLLRDKQFQLDDSAS